MSTSVSGPENGLSSVGLRNALNIALIVHLFFIVVAVGSNFAPSQLQSRILDKFKAYTRLFNFDLDYTAYHLTHATEADVDHRVEVLPRGKAANEPNNWVVLPPDMFRGCDAYKRYQRLGHTWAFQALNELDPAIFAQTIGTHFARERQILPQQLRCRRHYLQSREDLTQGTAARRNAQDPSFFAAVYTANAIVSDNGFVEVVRVDEASQVAQPTGQNNAGGSSRNERNR